MRDICRWHVEEFAYMFGRLKSVPEGAGTLLDHTACLFLHEHAEANKHKNSGLAVLLVGHAGGSKTGLHTRVRGTIGDLYLTLAEEILKAPAQNGIPKRNCVSDQRGSGETRCQDAFETCSQ